jgi:hypothetical protein
MPVEIKELHIKTVINEAGNQAGPLQNGGIKISPQDKALIVSECIEKVMEILKENKER